MKQRIRFLSGFWNGMSFVLGSVGRSQRNVEIVIEAMRRVYDEALWCANRAARTGDF